GIRDYKVTGVQTCALPISFMQRAESELLDLGVRAQRASWVQENFITDDTEILSAQAQEKLTAVTTQLALDARRFDHLQMPPALRSEERRVGKECRSGRE